MRLFFGTALSFWFSFFLCFSSVGQETVVPKKPLKVLSWNIYGLPRIAQLSKQTPSPKKTGKRERAVLIADTLAKTDIHILVLQETFHGGMRRILNRRLKEAFPYQYGPFNPSGASFKTNSGISVYSRIPLKVLHSIDYSACTGVDCFAKKGAALLQGEWQGVPFQIAGTHLQAGGPQALRDDQYRALSQELLEPFECLGVPQIICGDFNTHKNRDPEAYRHLLETIDAKDAVVQSAYKCTSNHAHKDLNSTHNTDKCSVIDFIFHKENGARVEVVNKQVIVWEHPWGEFGQRSLSDHFSVYAEFLLYGNSQVVLK